MHRALQRLRSDESGFGLITVVGFTAILSGVVAVAFAMSTNSLTSSRNHVEFGRALDAAETGIDQTLSRLQAARFTGAPYTSPTGLTIPSTLTGTAADAWARQQIEALAAANPSLVQSNGEGDYLAITPSNRQVIYSMSWVPSRANPSKVRVIKAEYLFSTFRPQHAILTGGDLNFSGSIDVVGAAAGISANVHTNGNMDISNSSVVVAGTVTAVGSYSAAGGATVGAGSQGGAQAQDIPDLDPNIIYQSQMPTYRSSWYDLCPDGTVKSPPAAIDPTTNKYLPCTGTLLADVADTSTTGFLGWTQSVVDGVRKWDDGNAHTDGVYYAYQGDIRVNDNNTGWKTTLLAEPTMTAGDPCSKVGGNIEYSLMTINASFITGQILAAGQDLVTQANFRAGEFGPGLFTAVDQIDLTTSSSFLWGAVIAGDKCDVPGSPASMPTVLQGIRLTYAGDLESPIGDVIRTTLWLEV